VELRQVMTAARRLSPAWIVCLIPMVGLLTSACGLAQADSTQSSSAGRADNAPASTRNSNHPPRCSDWQTQHLDIIRSNGFVVYCGPASAVVHGSGRWRVTRGACYGRGRFRRIHVGFETRRAIPHMSLGLIMDVPRGTLANGG
jgi:hypothetical protein